jgi:hypothetical protein
MSLMLPSRLFAVRRLLRLKNVSVVVLLAGLGAVSLSPVYVQSAFAQTPAQQLLAPFPSGGATLVQRVQSVVQADPTIVPALVALANSANPAQRAAMASGFARARGDIDPNAAQALNQALSQADAPIQSIYRLLSNQSGADALNELRNAALSMPSGPSTLVQACPYALPDQKNILGASLAQAARALQSQSNNAAAGNAMIQQVSRELSAVGDGGCRDAFAAALGDIPTAAVPGGAGGGGFGSGGGGFAQPFAFSPSGFGSGGALAISPN